MGKWTAIIILGLAQFIMVLDGTVMNVSIITASSSVRTEPMDGWQRGVLHTFLARRPLDA